MLSRQEQRPAYDPRLALPDVHETFGDALEAAAAAFPAQEVFVKETWRLTYGEWFTLADGLAGALVERGVRPGDVVPIVLDTSIEFAICYGAILLAGGVASGVNTRLGQNEISYILKKTGAKLAFMEDNGKFVDTDLILLRRGQLRDLWGGARLGKKRAARLPTDPAVIVWTSGTTGMPKGAWFDHNGLRAAIRFSGVTSGRFERKLMSTPFAHAGFMTKAWDYLAFGTTAVVPPVPWSAHDMLRLLVDEKINIGAGVPTQWTKLVTLEEAKAADFSNLRLGITATAPAAPDLIKAVIDVIGCPLIGRYAMTECPSIAGTRPEDDPETLYRTVGRPQPGIEVQLVDEAGVPVPPGEVGRLKVKSPYRMRGYWQEEEMTREVLLDDGWLLTGDYARIDPQGNIVLAGRTSEMYIRGGYNIYPIEVERTLKEHPGIGEVAVVGVAAPVIGEIGVAFVVPKNTKEPPTLEDLRQWVGERLADYKRPDRLVLVDALPLTSLMKIDKKVLKRMAEDN